MASAEADQFVSGNRGRRRFNSATRVSLLVGALLVGLVIAPLVRMLFASIRVESSARRFEFSLDNYRQAYGAATTYSSMANTVVFAVCAATFAMVVGTTLAWIAERADVPFAKLLLPITVIPLVLPGVLESIAWTFLLSPRTGLLNAALEAAFGLDEPPLNVYSMPGMIWVQGVGDVPLAFLLMSAAFKLMDPSLEESAAASGATRWQTVRKVTLPLLRPASLSVFLLLLVRSAESFEVPAVLGLPARIYVFTSEIYFAFHTLPVNYGLGSALAAGLLLVSLLGIGLYLRTVRQADRFGTVGGKGFRTNRVDLGRWKWAATVLVIGYVIVVVALPLFVIVWNSFMPYVRPPSLRSLADVTLDNYRFLFGHDPFYAALKNSLILGLLSATSVMVLSSVVAWVVHKSRVRGRGILEALIMTPIAVPGIVFGTALIVLYLRAPVTIYGTIWILLIAYVTKNLPYGMRAASGSIIQVRSELEEAAAVSGASWSRTFRRVTLPLIRPGFIAGWIYGLIVSFREFGASVLLAGPRSIVLSVLAFQLNDRGRLPAVAALGVIMVACLLLVVGFAHRLAGRIGVRP